jgi:hypothetical protein
MKYISLTNTNIGLRVKGWKKIFQVNGPRNKPGVSILISDKVDHQSYTQETTLIRGTIH